VLICQLSDLHVRPKGELYQGVVDSNRMFAEALAHVGRLDVRPDLVLLTGDLVDFGRPEEYRSLRELLAPVDLPYLVIPGNHDDRQALRAAFSDQAYFPSEGPLNYCIDDYPVRIVGLDSSVPGKHHGLIDAPALCWLAGVLAAEPAKPTLLMLHHPPFMTGIAYMDKYTLKEAGALERLVAQHANIEVVVCGHVHRPMTRRWGGTVVCACPSTATEIDLQLRPGAPPQSHSGPRGCMLHHWSPNDGMLSHWVNIGRYQGPFPFA
jgi:3',5'-cyclic AMP phosphodiesterase CpdA